MNYYVTWRLRMLRLSVRKKQAPPPPWISVRLKVENCVILGLLLLFSDLFFGSWGTRKSTCCAAEPNWPSRLLWKEQEQKCVCVCVCVCVLCGECVCVSVKVWKNKNSVCVCVCECVLEEEENTGCIKNSEAAQHHCVVSWQRVDPPPPPSPQTNISINMTPCTMDGHKECKWSNYFYEMQRYGYINFCKNLVYL